MTNNLHVLLDPLLFQGDIVLDPDERLALNHTDKTYASVSLKGQRWPGGIIPYVIGSDIGKLFVIFIVYSIHCVSLPQKDIESYIVSYILEKTRDKMYMNTSEAN